ncbi:PH domain-containing protein [Phanerochaete sordida]|uniref:PH domain-containing protein n=1 Tax=Phanerochaete sordida TaxID=48140 RepID=A0A9P3GRN9_9APHY|nr:PH domain-containing protein [Phanerochaete sordida]
MNVVVPKVKRGRVGAKLPTEPWSMVDSLPPDLAGPSYPMLPATSTPNSVIGSGIFVQEPDSYGTPDDSQEQDGSGERASSSESDTSTPYSSDVGDGQSCASVISQSSFDAYPSSLIPFDNFDTHASQCAEDSCSSPEPSFPPTPRLGVNVPAFLSTGYPSLFSPQSRPSFYDDLSATLEYDYSQAASRLPSSPPAQDAVSSLTLDESSPCDFQPGSSVQTIRAYNLQDQPPSHFRSSPCQDGTAPGHSHMDSLPLSPTTIRADDNAPRPTSSVSSACDDDADFVSIASDTSDEEYLTAPLSRSPSPTARLPRLEGSATLGLRLPSAEDPELSESSGVDIRERLSRLSFLTQSDAGSSRYASAHEYVDAAEEGSRSTRTQSQRGESSRQGGSNGRHQGSSSGYGSGQAGGVGFGGGSGGGRRDRDGDDDRYRRPHPRAAAPDYTTSETSSDDSSDEEETPRRTRPARRRGRSSSSSADDDVPLAQQIPTALRAQRTIRRQVRDEAVQKRRARSLRRPDPVEPPTSELPPLPTQRVTPERSASRPPSASRAPPIPQSPPKLAGRPRTKTLPSQIGGIPFSVGELTKKLLTTQTAPPLPQPPAAASTRTSQDVPGPLSPQHISSHLPSQHEQHANLRAPAQESISAVRLRAMRSFHRPRTTGGESELPPAVPAAGAQLGRSKTSATRRAQPLESQPAPALPPLAATGLERARSTRSHSRRPSVDRSARPSLDQEARPPMPPLPVAVTKMPAWQQRVFVNNLQRFHQVEITAASTARDVLEALQGQNALDNGAASGWMMWEVSQDFGMERPIRSFEVLSDVTNSWVTDKTVNFLMAKKTLLAPKLSRAAIPSSSPVCGGFVQWEYKRGKWQKRWLELREHSLWLSKRDTGKDQVQLCSLNNFDAYVVTRVSKAPKSYIFAVKSTDNISFFESTSDYVHIFSCDQKEGENWVEKILIARSYILYQDRNVLSTTGATANPGAGLSRAGTRKRPAQPLVNFSAAQTVSAAEPPPALTPVFAPGSLLAKNS